MAKKTARKTRPKVKVKVKSSKPNTVPRKTEFLVYEVSFGCWDYYQSCDSQKDADSYAARIHGPNLIVRLDLPKVKY